MAKIRSMKQSQVLCLSQDSDILQHMCLVCNNKRCVVFWRTQSIYHTHTYVVVFESPYIFMNILKTVGHLKIKIQNIWATMTASSLLRFWKYCFQNLWQPTFLKIMPFKNYCVTVQYILWLTNIIYSITFLSTLQDCQSLYSQLVLTSIHMNNLTIYQWVLIH